MKQNYLDVEEDERKTVKEISKLLDERSYHASRMGVIDKRVDFLKDWLKQTRHQKTTMLEETNRTLEQLREEAVKQRTQKLKENDKNA